MTGLPESRSDRYRVEFVCSGNICRSPSASVVLAALVADAGLPVDVTSSGIGDWHVGDAMDPRSARALERAGYDPSTHRARQVDAGEKVDVFVPMDASHAADLRRLGIPPERVIRFRDLDPEGPGDVPDPYFGDEDGFDVVLAMVERTCHAWVGALSELLRGAEATRP